METNKKKKPILDAATMDYAIQLAKQIHAKNSTWDYDTGPDIIDALEKVGKKYGN